MSKKKFFKVMFPVLFFLFLIQIDLLRIFSPDEYLQRYGGYYSDYLSEYKVAYALRMGADPNRKIDEDPKGETPFFVSYALEKNELVKLMLPHMNCSNLEYTLNMGRLYSGYVLIEQEYQSKCKQA